MSKTRCFTSVIQNFSWINQGDLVKAYRCACPWGVWGCRDRGRCTGIGAVKRPRPQVPEDTALLVTMWPLITCGHADRMLLAPNQFWVNSFYDKIPIHGAALFTT